LKSLLLLVVAAHQPLVPMVLAQVLVEVLAVFCMSQAFP
jgi:hypothetical protein